METKIIVEQLEDKQQIVTYKYLTEKLEIHPNKAKQLLNNYVSKLTDDQKYSITIVIGGILKENDEFCIVLAHDDHVATMRRRFKQIDFEHVYSIQPIRRFDDINNALYLVDSSLNNNTNLPSSIKRKEKVNDSTPLQRDVNEIDTDLPVSKETILPPNKVLNHKNEQIADQKIDKTEKKKNGLDYFGTKNKTNNTKLEETEKKVIPKKTNSDFFTKFKNSNKNPSTSNDYDDSKNKVPAETIVKEDDEIIEIESPTNNIKDNAKEEKCEEKSKKKLNKKKDNENKSKSKNNQKVKRKRIQTFDSSDEEINSEEEDKKRSEHVMDVEDDVDLVQPTPPRPTLRENRKKEKQTTTSTFIDDDGFVHTTKEVKLVETECEPLGECVGNGNTSESKELAVEPVVKKIKIVESDSAEKKKNKNKKSKNSPCQSALITSFFKTK